MNGGCAAAEGVGQWRVAIERNEPIAESTWRLRIDVAELATRIVPGQFLMLRIAGLDDPLIGRPLALYDVQDRSGVPHGVEVVYLVAGKMTSLLSRYLPGQELDVWGPLGNGFGYQPADHLIMVAGGIGQTPFLALAKEHLGLQAYGRPLPPQRPEQVTLCYGARSASLLAGVEDFRDAGVDVQIATEDGSAGKQGLVTDLLEELLVREPRGRERRIVCCGPEPMMEAVSRLARQLGVPAQVSLETPMACGIGICFSCVASITDEQGTVDYRRTCVEGPVFDAERVVW